MPKYYFHLKDGHTELDEDGTELADLKAARREAVKFSGEVLREGPGDSLWMGEPWRLWVTDQPNGAGTTLFTLNFSAEVGSGKPD